LNRMIALFMFVILTTSMCIGGEERLEAPAEKPSLVEEVGEKIAQKNAKDTFYGLLNRVPEVEGYDMAMLMYFILPPEEGPGAFIKEAYMTGYTSDTDNFGLSLLWLRTGMKIMAREMIKDGEAMEINGKTAYFKMEEGEGKLQWLEDSLLYEVKKEGATTSDELAVYARLIMSPVGNFDPQAEKYDSILLYQYVPDPLEGERLGALGNFGFEPRHMFGKYIKDETEYTLTILPGDIGVMLGQGESNQLSPGEDVQVGQWTAKAGQKEGKYKIIYVDEENLVVLTMETDMGNEAMVEESMKVVLSKAIEGSTQ